MIDALINDGDIVIMEPAQTVNDGEMAAVWVKDANEVTLKKFYRAGAQVRLQPMNATMAPIYHRAGNVQVAGAAWWARSGRCRRGRASRLSSAGSPSRRRASHAVLRSDGLD